MAILSKKEKLEILQRALKRETEKVREESLKKGEADGLRKGRLEGRLEGEANGLQKGRSEGRLEGRQEVARSMVRDGSIPLSKIAEFSGLTIGEVESIRNSLR